MPPGIRIRNGRTDLLGVGPDTECEILKECPVFVFVLRRTNRIQCGRCSGPSRVPKRTHVAAAGTVSVRLL